jgi:putative CocE/NonD family hydrolase
VDNAVFRNLEISLRDEVRVVGDVYLPRSGGKFPTIVFRTPYGRDDQNYRRYARFFSSHGFAFLNSDVRGRGDSEGEFVPYFNEGKDGRDVIEWVAKQSWSNGRIGTFGSSYSARIQWLTALERPRNLLAMISKVSPSDQFVESPTGVSDPMHISWRYLVSGRTLKSTEDIDWDSVYKTLPLKDMPSSLGLRFTDWEEDFSHQTLDSFWDRIGYQKKFDTIDVPTLHISGWYDDEQIGTFINYLGMRKESASAESRENQSMIIGPWGHNVNASSKLGDIDFGTSAVLDLDTIQLNWFKKWLVDKDTQVGKRVRVFIMGENRWMDLDDWPPAGTRNSKLFLTSGGRANGRYGDGKLVWRDLEIVDGSDEYSYDPSDPPPFVTEITSAQIGGPDNYSSVERRDDILVYRSPPLENDITFLGPVSADIFMETDVPDTDVMAMLLDVWPSGFSQRLCDGMTRGRYRNGMSSIKLLEKGKVHKFRIDLWNTGHRFAKGHMIGFNVSSAAFPKYSRNLNTGLDLASDSTMRVAKTKILHTKENPSSVSFSIYE